MYALTKERDMLKKDAEKKGDVSTLLLEKDEIIKQARPARPRLHTRVQRLGSRV